MIATTRPRTRRLLLGAFALSVLIHLFGGALWARAAHVVAQIMQRLPEQHQREQEVATSDTITLERRTVPRAAQRSLNRPHPRPVVRPQPVVQPPASRVAVVPEPEVNRPPSKADKPAPHVRPEIAHEARQAPLHDSKPGVAKAGAPAATRQAALTPEEIARLDAQFAKTIVAAHVDLATIQKRSEERPVAVKRYPMQFTGMQANLQRGEGYISPTTVGQRIGGTVSYYTHYTYMWPDGHIEDDDIPWPFHFPVARDLFALRVHLIPLQLPPPGFHLDRPLKPFLAHFLKTAGRG